MANFYVSAKGKKPSGLTVFSSLEAAQEFIGKSTEYDIWEEGYKVVFVDYNKNLVSAIKGSVDYPLDEVVTRPYNCGPLGVFESRWVAERFRVEHCDSGRIYHCLFTRSSDNAFWMYTGIRTSGCPGKSFADKVILTKRYVRDRKRKQ